MTATHIRHSNGQRLYSHTFIRRYWDTATDKTHSHKIPYTHSSLRHNTHTHTYTHYLFISYKMTTVELTWEYSDPATVVLNTAINLTETDKNNRNRVKCLPIDSHHTLKSWRGIVISDRVVIRRKWSKMIDKYVCILPKSLTITPVLR